MRRIRRQTDDDSDLVITILSFTSVVVITAGPPLAAVAEFLGLIRWGYDMIPLWVMFWFLFAMGAAAMAYNRLL